MLVAAGSQLFAACEFKLDLIAGSVDHEDLAVMQQSIQNRGRVDFITEVPVL